MSDGAEKRFDATPARRERAKREGKSARSAELCTLASFGAAVLAAIAAVPSAAAALATALRSTMTPAALHALAAGASQAGVSAALAAAGAATLVPAIGAAAAGIVVALAQTGGLHLVAIHLDLKRLDPVAGFKRMIGGEAIVGILRGTLAFGAALGAMAPVMRDTVASAATLASPAAAAGLVGTTALRACLAALAASALFAFADYLLARRRWLHGLKMSHDELKRDAKENDGDPQARSRRTAIHRSIVRGAIARTREASFVVVNPTHVAVALRYEPPEVPVPQILVRARDAAALRVRTMARECGIPVLEDVALARWLYAHGESGRPIPPDAYVAVAQIIASLARAGVLA